MTTVAWSRTATRPEVGRSPRGERALQWVPAVFLASAGWLAFHEYGWVAWVALLAGGYFGRAVGDLAVGIGRPVEDACEPGAHRRCR